MRITKENLKVSAHEFVDNMFSNAEVSLINVGHCAFAKHFIDKKFDMVDMFIEDGYIEIGNLETYFMEGMSKLGKVSIPAIGTTYTLDSNDVAKFFTIVKQKAVE